jgi:hypothetical protein
LRKLGLSLAHEQVVLFPAVKPPDSGSFPSLGARGCFMSHLGVLADARRRGVTAALILEDDCDFGDIQDVGACLHDLQHHGDWRVFYGGFSAALKDLQEQVSSTQLVRVAPQQALMQSHCVGMTAPAIDAAHAYFSAMLERAAGDPAGGPMHVDGAYCWFRAAHPALPTYCAQPQVAFQRPSMSNVTSQRWFDQGLVGRCVTRPWRIVKRRLGLHLK